MTELIQDGPFVINEPAKDFIDWLMRNTQGVLVIPQRTGNRTLYLSAEYAKDKSETQTAVFFVLVTSRSRYIPFAIPRDLPVPAPIFELLREEPDDPLVGEACVFRIELREQSLIVVRTACLLPALETWYRQKLDLIFRTFPEALRDMQGSVDADQQEELPQIVQKERLGVEMNWSLLIDTTPFLCRSWFLQAKILPGLVAVPEDGGHISLQSPYLREGNAGGGVIEYSAHFVSESGTTATVEDWGVAISIDVLPLAPQRVKVAIKCLLLPLIPYCEQLVAEVRRDYGHLVHKDADSAEPPVSLELPQSSRSPYPGGRPRLSANQWASEQVNELGRKPEDVYLEWLKRRPDQGHTISDPMDSFKKAIRPRKKRGINE